MDAWRGGLIAFQEKMVDDNDEDEYVFRMVAESLAELDELPKPIHGGSRPGRGPNLLRDREAWNQRMINDYFSETPVFGADVFCRRFRMQQSLFLTIMDAVCEYDPYFVQRRDATGALGLSSHQKCTAALRMLAYGVSADATDEYCRIGESTAMESMKCYVAAVRAVFGPHHLQEPTRDNFEQQLRINANQGFIGMFASIDWMHYQWKNCPVAWQGDFGDRDGNRSIILEAIANQLHHIWHVFFCLRGSNNHINVLDRSPLVQRMLEGEGRDLPFEINGKFYNRYYLLADGIYPQWSCFVQTINLSGDEKRKHFAKVQEAARKDVERAFGVLQGRFAIIANPCREWSMSTITDIMFACVVLHNMILDDEKSLDLEDLNLRGPVTFRRGLTFRDLMLGTREIENEDTHYSLRGDLIEHLWALKGATMY